MAYRYPPWWRETVTVYNKVTEGGKLVYYRHVLEGCHIKRERVTKTDSGNRGVSSVVTLRARYDTNYLTPSSYVDSCAAVQGRYFTFCPGDVILYGNVPDEMSDEPGKRPADLLAAYEGFVVQSACDNTGARPEHYRITGA